MIKKIITAVTTVALFAGVVPGAFANGYMNNYNSHPYNCDHNQQYHNQYMHKYYPMHMQYNHYLPAGYSIVGNGAFSRNRLNANFNNSFRATQENFTDINNDVNTYQDTGHNNANFNTGGDVRINTGDASSTVDIHNMAGANVLGR